MIGGNDFLYHRKLRKQLPAGVPRFFKNRFPFVEKMNLCLHS